MANHGDRISNDLGDTITEHNTNLCFARSRTDSFRKRPQTVCLQAAAPSASDRSNVLFCCDQCDLDERNGHPTASVTRHAVRISERLSGGTEPSVPIFCLLMKFQSVYRIHIFFSFELKKLHTHCTVTTYCRQCTIGIAMACSASASCIG